MRLSLIAINARYTHSCPALFYVREHFAAALPRARFVLEQFTINDPTYEVLLAISGTTPEILCFSVSIWNVSVIRRLIADLSLVLPKVPIILGGPEAPAIPQEELPPQCTVVEGEVEGLGPQFFDDLVAGRLKARYRTATAPRFAMPYRDEDFTGPLQNRNIYYESSRGCPFACSYCLSSIERGVRYRPLEEVKTELRRLLAHQPKMLRFIDRTFNADPDRALAIWRFLLDQPGKTRFHFEIAPDRFTEAMFAFLATVPPGRFQFEIGLQSTNPESLAAVNRRMDCDRAADCLLRLRAMDSIHLHLDLILGLPFETEESFRTSFNAAFAMAPHHLQMGLLKLLPGTALSRDREGFGLIASATSPYPILASRWLDHSAIRRLYRFGEWVEAFYRQDFFGCTLDYLRRSGEEPFSFFAGLLDYAESRGFFGLAKTQELLCEILVGFGESRPDRELFLELLACDWLLSGRRLPLPGACEDQSRATRDLLWKNLPAEYPPLYHRAKRNAFFKRAIFARFSGELLRTVGLADGTGPGFLCVLPERDESGVRRQQRHTVFFV